MSGGRKRRKRQSFSASGSAIASPANTALRIGRQFAGKHRRLGLAVENLAVEPLARLRHADDRIHRRAAMANLRFARRTDRGERDHVDRRADAFGARDRTRRQQAQDILQAIMAGMMQMVGLGRREQDAVDARAEHRRKQRRAAGAKGLQHFGQRVFEIAHRRRAGIQRRQRVDEHDLPVEPREMIAKEGTHDMRLIGLVAPLHHRGERGMRRVPRLPRPAAARRSGPGEPSRSPGIRKRPGGKVESA